MPKFVVVLFFCIALFNCASRQTAKQANAIAPIDIFSGKDDTSLFAKQPVVLTVYLTPDSAYKTVN